MCCVARHAMVMCCIAWYAMVMYCIAWYAMVSQGIVRRRNKARHLDRRRFPDYGSSRPCQRPQTYIFPFTTASELTPRFLMIPKMRWLYHYTVYHCSACIGSPIRRLSPFMAEISNWAWAPYFCHTVGYPSQMSRCFREKFKIIF